MKLHSHVPASRSQLALLGAGASAVVVALVVAGVLLYRGQGDPSRFAEPAAVGEALTLVTNEEGRVQLPVREGDPSLEATAWVRDLFAQLDIHDGVPPIANDTLLAGAESYPPVWVAYFAAVSGIPLDDATRERARADVAGLAPSQEPAAVADTVMAVWATTQSGLASELDGDVVTWTRAALATCAGNAYVVAHAAEALVSLGDDVDTVRGQVAGCVSAAPPPTDAFGIPENEEELLALVGESLAYGLVGWPTEEHRDAVAHALAPQPWSSLDPWWVHHSLRGFVAAGGDPQEYEPVAQAWLESIADDGSMPVYLQDSPSAEQDMFAAMVVAVTGAPWKGLSPRDLRAVAVDREGWTDEQHAIWTLTAHVRGVELTADEIATGRQGIRRCAEAVVTPSTLRIGWVCTLAADALGLTVQRPAVDEDVVYRGVPPEVAVEAAAVLRPAALPDDVRKALGAISRAPTQYSTQTVAQALLVARVYPESGADEAMLRRAVERSRGEAELRSLFTLRPEEDVIDMYATYWAHTAAAAGGTA